MVTNINFTYPLDTVKGIIENFRNSAFIFTLTGSRFFGNPNEDSDWDFFVEFSSKLVHFLNEMGFEEIEDERYFDGSVATIFEKKLADGKIQIQVLYPMIYKIKFNLNNWIKNCYGYSFSTMSKEQRGFVWETSIRLCNSKLFKPLSDAINSEKKTEVENIPNIVIDLESNFLKPIDREKVPIWL